MSEKWILAAAGLLSVLGSFVSLAHEREIPHAGPIFLFSILVGLVVGHKLQGNLGRFVVVYQLTIFCCSLFVTVLMNGMR